MSVSSETTKGNISNCNMTSFKRFESKPVIKIILIYDRLNLWRHRKFITIFYQFLHIRIEIIHESHMYMLFLPRVGVYVSFLPLAYARGKTSWQKGLPVVKTIYTYGFPLRKMPRVQKIVGSISVRVEQDYKFGFVTSPIALSSKSSGRNCSVIFRYKSNRVCSTCKLIKRKKTKKCLQWIKVVEKNNST